MEGTLSASHRSVPTAKYARDTRRGVTEGIRTALSVESKAGPPRLPSTGLAARATAKGMEEMRLR